MAPLGKGEAFVRALPIRRFYGVGAVTEAKIKPLGVHTREDLPLPLAAVHLPPPARSSPHPTARLVPELRKHGHRGEVFRRVLETVVKFPLANRRARHHRAARRASWRRRLPRPSADDSDARQNQIKAGHELLPVVMIAQLRRYLTDERIVHGVHLDPPRGDIGQEG